MIIDTFVQLGNFSIRTTILATLLSLLLCLLLIKFSPQKIKKHFPNKTLDLFFSLLLVFIIAWKLSPLLIQPDLWKKPLILLYIQGIGKEVWLAGIITVVYLLWKIKQMKMPFITIADSLTIALYLFLFFYSLVVYTPGTFLSQIPINIYREIIIVGFLIYLYKSKPLASGIIAGYGLIIIGAWELILTLLKAEPALLIYYFTLSQWFALLCLFTGIYVLFFKLDKQK